MRNPGATRPFGRRQLVSCWLLSITLISPRALPSQPKGLTGTWLRNPDQSDDAEKKIQETARAMFEKVTKGGRNIAAEDIPRIEKRLQHVIATFVQFAEALEIEETSGELRIDDGEGRVRIFYVDGKRHQRQAPDGTKLETLCRRQGGRIVVEQKLEGGGQIVETYVTSAVGEQMVLTVHFSSKRFRRPLIVRSVYDRQE